MRLDTLKDRLCLIYEFIITHWLSPTRISLNKKQRALVGLKLSLFVVANIKVILFRAL